MPAGLPPPAPADGGTGAAAAANDDGLPPAAEDDAPAPAIAWGPRLQAIVAYDGTLFSGFQLQALVPPGAAADGRVGPGAGPPAAIAGARANRRAKKLAAAAAARGAEPAAGADAAAPVQPALNRRARQAEVKHPAVVRTVQGELEAAAARVYGVGVRVVGASRTDAGVHARGQSAHLDPPLGADGRPRDPVTDARLLNGRLPPDVRVLSLRPAPPGFQAHGSSYGKAYSYHVCSSWEGPDPLAGPARGWWVRGLWCRQHKRPPGADAADVLALDTGRMRELAAALQGRRDFAAFEDTRSFAARRARGRAAKIISESRAGGGGGAPAGPGAADEDEGGDELMYEGEEEEEEEEEEEQQGDADGGERLMDGRRPVAADDAPPAGEAPSASASAGAGAGADGGRVRALRGVAAAAAAAGGRPQDFLGGAELGSRRSTVRHLWRIEVSEPSPGNFRIDVEGDGFLYRMVRNLAACLVEVGAGRLTVPAALAAVASRDRAALPCCPAPPCGLVLERVFYRHDAEPARDALRTGAAPSEP